MSTEDSLEALIDASSAPSPKITPPPHTLTPSKSYKGIARSPMKPKTTDDSRLAALSGDAAILFDTLQSKT